MSETCPGYALRLTVCRSRGRGEQPAVPGFAAAAALLTLRERAIWLFRISGVSFRKPLSITRKTAMNMTAGNSYVMRPRSFGLSSQLVSAVS